MLQQLTLRDMTLAGRPGPELLSLAPALTYLSFHLAALKSAIEPGTPLFGYGLSSPTYEADFIESLSG